MGKQDDARIAALVKKNSAKQPKKPKDPSQFDDTLRIRSEDQGPDAQRIFKDIADEYVPLKASYLRKLFPDNDTYKAIRDRLIETKTILCDGVYHQADGQTWKSTDPRYKNGKCYGYRLGPRWEGVRHERVTLSARHSPPCLRPSPRRRGMWSPTGSPPSRSRSSVLNPVLSICCTPLS